MSAAIAIAIATAARAIVRRTRGSTHVKHPHDLVMGSYSVHTSKATLARGEAEIQRIGALLRRERRSA